MGRKIPGRKHRGVKDPLQQQAKRISSLQNKINAPPAILDFQEIPKSAERLFKRCQAVQNGSIPTKKKNRKKRKNNLINTQQFIGKEIKLPGMTRPEKPVPTLIQQAGESDNHFLYRVHEACHEAIQETKFEQKYGVNVRTDPETGQVSLIKKSKEEIEEDMVGRPKKKKKKKNKESDEGKPSKKERRKQKLKELKQVKMEKSEDDFGRFQDHVKFGEVVHAPPSFKTLPKKVVNQGTTPRPGRKNLLLKSLIQPGVEAVSTSTKKTKRKDLPITTQQRLELQRQQAVAAYRMLKAQK